jgi:hypothetical protein
VERQKEMWEQNLLNAQLVPMCRDQPANADRRVLWARRLLSRIVVSLFYVGFFFVFFFFSLTGLLIIYFLRFH